MSLQPIEVAYITAIVFAVAVAFLVRYSQHRVSRRQG